MDKDELKKLSEKHKIKRAEYMACLMSGGYGPESDALGDALDKIRETLIENKAWDFFDDKR